MDRIFNGESDLKKSSLNSGGCEKHVGGDSCPISACCETRLGGMSTWTGDGTNWTSHLR
jgi:hypothetical protein